MQDRLLKVAEVAEILDLGIEFPPSSSGGILQLVT
jgi:hypothetical protein